MTRPRVVHRAQERNVARGSVHPQRPRFRQVLCAFDVDMFNEIRARAIVEHTSFAEQVRLLCEWGLETEQMGETS